MLLLRVVALALAGVLFAVPICGQDEAPGSPSIAPQDLRAAERALADARDELEEIVGRELLEAEAPPLPGAEGMEALGEWREHRELLTRLSSVPPEEWSERDWELVDGLLPFDLTCRAVLAGGDDGGGGAPDERVGAADRAAERPAGQPIGPESDQSGEDRMPDLLTLLNGARVVALGDRLALLRGDEAAAAEGIALRFGLAERLSLQHGLAEPLIGSVIREIALLDLEWVVERSATSRATLTRLDDLLFRAHLEVPDSAAIVAREGLRLTDPDRPLPDVAVPDEEMSAVALAPMARDFETMARECRERGCIGVAEALSEDRTQATKGGAAVGRIISDLLMPNFVDMTRKLERGMELVELARAAVALRLEAFDQGVYPVSPERVVDGLGLEADALDGLRYEVRPDGGVSLGVELDEDIDSYPEPRRRLMSELVAWELPPPPELERSSPRPPDP